MTLKGKLHHVSPALTPSMMPEVYLKDAVPSAWPLSRTASLGACKQGLDDGDSLRIRFVSNHGKNFTFTAGIRISQDTSQRRELFWALGWGVGRRISRIRKSQQGVN